MNPGARLGPYEIVSQIGSGGMGVVYRARDARLGRDVAIKVLPSSIATDSERLRRFDQEARAAASINHPNILAVYDIGAGDGVPYIVTELLEGTTLRTKLGEGALPVRTALDYGMQIARGLTAAHERGIVHRDLKPENIFITPDGLLKILDFGLAKLTQPETPAVGASNLATGAGVLERFDTQPGTVLGTAGYMSPEQVRGTSVDHRTDIFALGVILYESLSGRRAFGGETPMDAMTAILKEQPPTLPVAQGQIPLALDRVVTRCMEKDPAGRFQSTRDLTFALESIAATPVSATVPVSAVEGRRRFPFAWVIGGTVLAIVAVMLWLGRNQSESPTDSTPVTFTALAPEGWRVDAPEEILKGPFAVSPDGRHIVFVARNPRGQTQLWLRSLDRLEAKPINGTENARFPFWAPTSDWVAYTVSRELRKVAITGEMPVMICENCVTVAGAWSSEGTILISPPTGGLLQLSSNGGEPAPATSLLSDESYHADPVFLPDGKHFLFRTGLGKVFAGTLDAPAERVEIPLPAGINGLWYASDHIVYSRGGAVLAQAFDADRLELRGSAEQILDGIRTATQAGRSADMVSVSGRTLAYIAGSDTGVQALQWFDRTGKPLGTIGDRAGYSNLELSVDDRRLAVGVLDPSKRTRDIWVFDTERGVGTRITSDPAEERSAVLSPDGRSIVFNSIRTGAFEFYRQSLDSAAGDASNVPFFADKRSKDANSWSHDGRFILYRVSGGATLNDLWVLPLSGGEPSPYLATPFDEAAGRFSPDGKWIAYTSTESGRVEVYVATFPSASGKVRVSTDGGDSPRWRADGKELFYLAPDGMLKVLSIDTSRGEASLGAVHDLFLLNVPVGTFHPYAVTRDGQRFMVNTDVGTSSAITAIVNWKP